MPDIVFI